MSHYILKLQPTREAMLREGLTAEENEAVSEHLSYLQNMASQGKLFMAGRTLLADSRAFGVAIFTAISDEEAHSIVNNDPAIARGVMQGEVYPFRVALWSGNPLALAGDAPPDA